MARSYEFTFESRLAAPHDAVWVHATSMRGVNRELFPLVRMTYPPEAAALGNLQVPLRQRLFRSWILFLGVLPIDYDDLTFDTFELGRFLERSPMLTQREWMHERCVEAVDGGCVLRDHVTFVPRLALLSVLQQPIFRFAFWWRHRNLRRLFGTLG